MHRVMVDVAEFRELFGEEFMASAKGCSSVGGHNVGTFKNDCI